MFVNLLLKTAIQGIIKSGATCPAKSNVFIIGAKSGKTIKVISTQSKKNPNKKTNPIITKSIPQGPKPISFTK